MSRVYEQGVPRLFATLLASGPHRTSQVKFADLVVATTVHLAVFWTLIWLTAHAARPVLAFAPDVNTLILTDNTAVSMRGSNGAGRTAAPLHRSAAPVRNTQLADLTALAPPTLPDLTDVIAAVEQRFKEIVSVAIGDDLIGSAAAQLDFSLARDTVPREPTIEELERGVVYRRYTTAPELLNKPEIAHLLEQRYPPDLIALDVQGVTALWLLLDKTGVIRKAKVAHSSGHVWLDRLAMKMVPYMHFAPALNNGNATAVWVQLPVRFQVQDGQ